MDKNEKRNVVFILEDYTIISNQLVESLKKNKDLSSYDLEFCESENISDANGRYGKLRDRIACMVCDSNMSALGLPEEMQSESANGLFSGFLWLCDKIQNGDDSLLHKTIIFTAYYDQLSKKIKNNEEQTTIKNNMVFINKKSIASSNDSEIEIVHEIIKILKKEHTG